MTNNRLTEEMFRLDEIKYDIDYVIQLSMFENDESTWEIIKDIQDMLYDRFGIE